MEAIKKLREYAKLWEGVTIANVSMLSDNLNNIADTIQYEADRWFMRVPADADGVPVHVGVMVTDPDGIPLKVEYVGEDCVLLCNGDGVTTEFALARQCHRYHEPTVEDVLREFVREFNRDDSELCDDEIIEAFAKRLRLADEYEGV